MKVSIKKLCLDILKPHKPNIVDLSAELCRIPGVHGAEIATHEIDKNTETIKLTLEGSNLDYTQICHTIEQSGGVIHAVNQVSAAKSKK